MMGDKGAAFIIVIWVIASLALLFGIAMEGASTDMVLTKNFMDWNSSYFISRSGVEEAIHMLCQDNHDFDSFDAPWAQLAQRGWISLPTGQYMVMVEDEGSKLNLNTVTESMLRSLTILNEEMIDSFLDWRDVDDDTRSQGAEKEYYLYIDGGYEPTNGLFESVEELKYIKGFGEKYSQMSALFTVYGKFNPNTVSADAFDALLVALDIDLFQAQMATNDLIAYRKSGKKVVEEDDLKAAIPSLAESWENVLPFITLEGSININTASQEVLKTIFHQSGSLEGLEQVLKLRETSPFTELKGIVAESERAKVLTEYLIVKSRYFKITSMGMARDSKVVCHIEAVVERYKNSSDEWSIRILSWMVR